MGFITLGSGHVVHASLLPDLNPAGSIEVYVGQWGCLLKGQVDLDGDVVDMVNDHFWSLVDDPSSKT